MLRSTGLCLYLNFEFEFASVSVSVSVSVCFVAYKSIHVCIYCSCGVTGTLLPTIEKVYKLNYATVSLLFVSFCIGYSFSAFGSGRLIRRYV